MKMLNYHGEPMDCHEKGLMFSGWFLVFLLFVGLFFIGCSSSPATEGYKSDQEAARDKYKFDMIYFDWRGVYLVKLQGHEYLRAGDFIIHTASCPGRHGLHGE